MEDKDKDIKGAQPPNKKRLEIGKNEDRNGIFKNLKRDSYKITKNEITQNSTEPSTSVCEKNKKDFKKNQQGFSNLVNIFVPGLTRNFPSGTEGEFMKQLENQKDKKYAEVHLYDSTNEYILSPIRTEEKRDPYYNDIVSYEGEIIYSTVELIQKRIVITPEEQKTFIALCNAIRKRLRRVAPEFFQYKHINDFIRSRKFSDMVTWGIDLSLSDIAKERGLKTPLSKADKERLLNHIRNLAAYQIRVNKEIWLTAREKVRMEKGFNLLNGYEYEKGEKDTKGKKRKRGKVVVFPSKETLITLLAEGFSVPKELLKLQGSSFNLATFLYTHPLHQTFSENKLIEECQFSSAIFEQRAEKAKLYEVLDKLQAKGLIRYKKTELYDGRPGVKVEIPKQKERAESILEREKLLTDLYTGNYNLFEALSSEISK